MSQRTNPSTAGIVINRCSLQYRHEMLHTKGSVHPQPDRAISKAWRKTACHGRKAAEPCASVLAAAWGMCIKNHANAPKLTLRRSLRAHKQSHHTQKDCQLRGSTEKESSSGTTELGQTDPSVPERIRGTPSSSSWWQQNIEYLGCRVRTPSWMFAEMLEVAAGVAGAVPGAILLGTEWAPSLAGLEKAMNPIEPRPGTRRSGAH